LLGTSIGVLAGYFRGWTALDAADRSVPGAAAVAAAAGHGHAVPRPLSPAFWAPRGGIFILIVFAIGVTSWMQTARIVRGEVLALKEREFVLAAGRSARPVRMILRHILPKRVSRSWWRPRWGWPGDHHRKRCPSWAWASRPTSRPGAGCCSTVDHHADYPERVIWPGHAISLTVLSVNYIGDGLRDALDPRIRGR
jgi:peptide/nickel transport system permease protein